MKSSIDQKLTALTKRRYDRQAAGYDLKNRLMERMAMRKWRALLWEKVKGPRVLEIGVGTGANFPFYRQDLEVTAIDLSDRMLEQAEKKARRDGVKVELHQMDAQALEFPDASFDDVITTFVFCSVPDPVLGLREAGRVCKPDGQIVLLEHVRSESAFGYVMDWLNPLAVRLTGANINRRTVENVQRAGLKIEHVDSFFFNIVKLIVARPNTD